MSTHEPDSASKLPLETAQSEKIQSNAHNESPMKIQLDLGGKPDAQIQQLSQEIKELEGQVRSMRQTLEDSYKKQRDLANERAKLKQRFQSASDLSMQSMEMLKLILR